MTCSPSLRWVRRVAAVVVGDFWTYAQTTEDAGKVRPNPNLNLNSDPNPNPR